ncbi:UNVERIFIED_CONTAM: hypothetical protein Sradi_5613100 [Sesamum radiatum]|uniref:Uncharacterized protein n=1 Tax=Sesamum radiatum TaxID=300843 RepID=A0AAW2KZY4_SESRA
MSCLSSAIYEHFGKRRTQVYGGSRGTGVKALTTLSSSPGEEASPSISFSSSSIKRRKAVAIRRRLRLRPLEGPVDRESALLEVGFGGIIARVIFPPQIERTHQKKNS